MYKMIYINKQIIKIIISKIIKLKIKLYNIILSRIRSISKIKSKLWSNPSGF